ncbi:hypothetical protein B7P43_G06018 [Cryptotermes secundus]|uniref:Histone-lysine N-methyltransferase SETMAR n=1 Tax=Cryptotermes secundus TaxID=105785 RepID=A0A2J7QZC7_9NEOP|nr:hypothetical protein B7P43_G06018 [Cryptotermes secundus]
MVLLDRLVTVEVPDRLQIRHGSAYKINQNRLGVHKVCARWVPKQFTDVVLLHDNSRPRTAAHTAETLRKLKFDITAHPPYSPDLSPSDGHFLGPLKGTLRGRRFTSGQGVEEAVHACLASQPTTPLPRTQGSLCNLSQIYPIHTIPSYFSKIHFNIVHPPTRWSPQWSLYVWLSHQYPVCISLVHIRATCPAHFILHDLVILIILGKEYKVVRDQVSHPYRATSKIIVIYILIVMFLDSRREDKRFWTER